MDLSSVSLLERYFAGPRCKLHSPINSYYRRDPDTNNVTRECLECDSLKKKEPVVDWGCSCGRVFLSVAGYIVAVQGDIVRDPDLTMLTTVGARTWTPELIKHVATRANGGKLPT